MNTPTICIVRGSDYIRDEFTFMGVWWDWPVAGWKQRGTTQGDMTQSNRHRCPSLLRHTRVPGWKTMACDSPTSRLSRLGIKGRWLTMRVSSTQWLISSSNSAGLLLGVRFSRCCREAFG